MKVCLQCSEPHPDDAVRCSRDGSELRTVADPLIGRTLGGRYRILSRLGAGGMSNVYLARHAMIDRLVGIKALRRDLAGDPIQRDRFYREARAVNRINHQNIVEITDYGETDDGLIYLVLEYVPGTSLLKECAHAPFPAARAFHIAEQIASGLGRAHQMAVVHRDLKPENILLVHREGQHDFVKILDFGVAKIFDAPALTRSQQIFGTPGYIAPEYIQSTDIDGRSDLYSLGVILYEMITGALPFDYEYPGDLLVKHITEPPIPPRERRSGIHPAVEEFVLRALRKDPNERFRDAFHFIEELNEVRTRARIPEWHGPHEAATLSYPAGTSSSSLAHVAEQRTVYGDTVPDGLPAALRNDGEREPVASGPKEGSSGDWHVESPPTLEGLSGLARWRQRFEGIAEAYRRMVSNEPVPEPIIDAIAFSSRTVERLEACASQAEEKERQIQRLKDEARAFRAGLGRRIDDLGSKLSRARRDFEKAAARRNDVRARREIIGARVRRGTATVDEEQVLVSELDTLDSEVDTRARRSDALEAQLADVQAELDSRNEWIEAELDKLTRSLSNDVHEFEMMTQRIRRPLAMVESFVKEHTGSLRDSDSGQWNPA